MGRFVEVNDEGAARSAAGQLSSLGSQLDNHSTPPEIDWGGDRFGERMIERYTHLNIPEKAIDEKGLLGGDLTRLGDATAGAVDEIPVQDALNTADLSQVQAPEV